MLVVEVQEMRVVAYAGVGVLGGIVILESGFGISVVGRRHVSCDEHTSTRFTVAPASAGCPGGVSPPAWLKYARHSSHRMSDNRNSEAAFKYHNATKHSYASVRNNPHFLDFNNQPIPFKIYPTLPPTPLPAEVRQTGVAALSAISEVVMPETDSVPDLEAIAQLLYLSAGITRHRKYPGGEIYFRAAACTGALYEVELYLVCGELANLAAGVYHFAAAEFGLRKLRTGDYRGVLIEATAANTPSLMLPSPSSAPAPTGAMRGSIRTAPTGISAGYRHAAGQPAGCRHGAGPARQSGLWFCR